MTQSTLQDANARLKECVRLGSRNRLTPTSETSHFQTSADATAMSAFLPLATVERTSLEVRFVPTRDMGVIISTAVAGLIE